MCHSHCLQVDVVVICWPISSVAPLPVSVLDAACEFPLFLLVPSLEFASIPSQLIHVVFDFGTSRESALIDEARVGQFGLVASLDLPPGSPPMPTSPLQHCVATLCSNIPSVPASTQSALDPVGPC